MYAAYSATAREHASRVSPWHTAWLLPFRMRHATPRNITPCAPPHHHHQAEELAKDGRSEREEKERQRLVSVEAQLRRAQEAQATLERQVTHLNKQLELEVSRRK